MNKDSDRDQIIENIFEQIDAICRDFRRKWKQGNRPELQPLLEQVDEKAQSGLFRNLLPIEIEYRRRANENPTSEEYIKRFPQFARHIRQAFYESTMMSMAASISTPRFSLDDQLVDQTQSFKIPAANRLGDYQLIQEIGRGGFGVVYQAKHIQRNHLVALKTLPLGQNLQGDDDAERLHKFRREFRSLADINHRNLVGMQTLEVDGSQWFFTMDLVSGTDFLDYVRPDQTLDEDRLRKVLPQLANGIMALHGQRIIHRDLKPSNVLVDERGNVTILDFGLVVELQQRTDQTLSLPSSRFAGTPLYAAPEQIEGTATAASDWYALGVMLYEALTGERPFSGSALQVFEQKKNHPPPSLANRPDLPADLTVLTDRLLQKDPANRPDALEMAKSLSLAESDSQAIADIDDSFEDSGISSGHQLIGREQQLAQLRKELQGLTVDRQPSAVFITGNSGEGKSSLAEKFLGPLRKGLEVLVLSGRCYDRETVPFKAIDSIVDALVSFLRGRKNEQLNEMLPPDTRLLAHLFPVMRRVAAIAELEKTPLGQLDSRQIRNRAFQAFCDLLRKIGSQTPVVMFIDDLQWGDSDSGTILFQMLHREDAPALMLLGSYRRDEADQSPFLQEWFRLESATEKSLARPNVVVGPLSETQCNSLVVNRIGFDNDLIRQRAKELYQSTGGNPYFLDQLIDCFDPETGSFSAAPLVEVIERKLGQLPTDALPLLQIISVSGQAISATEASRAAGDNPSSIATLTHMRTERLVRLIGSDEQQVIDTYHDKIRETILDGLEDSVRLDLHLRIGETIEAADEVDVSKVLESIDEGDPDIAKTPGRIFDLAYHFAEAENAEKGFAYSLLAAEQAHAQFALDVAIEKFQVAKRLLPDRSDKIRFRVDVGRAKTLMLLGRFQEARAILETTRELQTGPQQKTMVELLIVDSLHRSAASQQNIADLEKLLRDLNVRVPRSSFGKRLANILLSIAPQIMLGFGKDSLSSTRKIERQLAVELLNQLVMAYTLHNPMDAVWASNVAYWIAKQANEPKLIVSSASRLASSCAFSGLPNSDRYVNEAMDVARSLNDIELDAETQYFRSIAAIAEGRHQEALEFSGESHRLNQAIGDTYRMNYSRFMKARAHSRIGNGADCIEELSEIMIWAVKTGADRIFQVMLEPWAYITDGDLPFDYLRSCFQFCDTLGTQVQFFVAECIWHRYHGRMEAYVDSAETAFRLMKGSRQSRNRMMNLPYALHAQAIREYGESLTQSNPRQSLRLKKQALRLAKQAVRIYSRFPGNLAYALREVGLANASLGNAERGVHAVQKSCEVAKSRGEKLEYAKSLLACRQLGEKLNKPEATSLLDEANTLMSDFRKQVAAAQAKVFGNEVVQDRKPSSQ